MNEMTAWYLGYREKIALQLPWQEDSVSDSPYVGAGSLLGGGGLLYGAHPFGRGGPLTRLLQKGMFENVANAELDLEYLQDMRDIALEGADDVKKWIAEYEPQGATSALQRVKSYENRAAGFAEQIPEAAKALRKAKSVAAARDLGEHALRLGGLGLLGYGAYNLLSGDE